MSSKLSPDPIVPSAPAVPSTSYEAVTTSVSPYNRSSCFSLCFHKKTLDDLLNDRGYQANQIDYFNVNNNILEGDTTIDTSKLQSTLRLKVFISPVKVNECCCTAFSCMPKYYWYHKDLTQQKEFQLKSSITYNHDGIDTLFKFWKLDGDVGFRINENWKKWSLLLDQDVIVIDEKTKKYFCVHLTDVFEHDERAMNRRS